MPSTPRHQVEEEAPVLIGKGRKREHSKGEAKAAKKDWSLGAAIDKDGLEWLKANCYLWVRSKKFYMQKKAVWKMKA
ncbi:hypothetical protein DPMN_130894 [Dreissena polymorpha]|uniref:Uncharacterized protein n=1 Tax=Dreissena polymorpha TaxID=45954 RepID=A0A9D4H3N1_DREPO|nr:hypothetical protein DPMN_130894 [Dreissena polymorpha]